ncbi:unannotated protein [freshwater metagenome]|uniref:Unannotated protein n=1 Tax=freshwater metagenome TaxID=449393 RepID=A0A6J7IQW1_9ZZZZ|nr:alpha/beta fold hydrolase [Actinomycetota bacterium]
MTSGRAPLISSLTVTAVITLGLGLLPASSTAAPAVNVTFTPKLTYVTCPVDEDLPPRTKCAKLTVPLDWQTPNDGRTIQIAMRVTKPRSDPGKLGLTWNPGGPGSSAVNMHEFFYSLMPDSIRDRFDVISWDPRGVAKSEPNLKECTPVSVKPPATGPVDWDAYWQKTAALEGAASAACFAANPNAAPYLGTWQVVRDMDAMRAALGYPRWNYWGISYGTRIGNAYARTFPNKLRALIEDASVMANESIGRFGATTPAGDHAAVEVYSALVGNGQAYKIRAINAYLNDSVIADGDGSVLDRWNFNAVLNSLARSQSQYRVMRDLVNNAYDYVTKSERPNNGGQVADLDLDDFVPVPDDDFIIPNPDSDAFIIKFVSCADMADRPTSADLARMSREAEQNYGTSYGSVGRASLCLGLPSGYSPPSMPADTTIALSNAPLFLLSSGDAATPWIWGRSLANTFAKSRTLTVESTTHGILAVLSACINDVVEKYLLTLRLPRTDVFCPYVADKPAAKVKKTSQGNKAYVAG